MRSPWSSSSPRVAWIALVSLRILLQEVLRRVDAGRGQQLRMLARLVAEALGAVGDGRDQLLRLGLGGGADLLGPRADRIGRGGDVGGQLAQELGLAVERGLEQCSAARVRLPRSGARSRRGSSARSCRNAAPTVCDSVSRLADLLVDPLLQKLGGGLGAARPAVWVSRREGGAEALGRACWRSRSGARSRRAATGRSRRRGC